MHAYGVDVLDPAVTPRRVHVLVSNLPPSARRPGQPWSVESELLAALIDAVNQNTYVAAKAAGAKGVKPPRPVPRPEDPLRDMRNADRVTQPARHPRAIPRPEDGPVKTSGWAEAILMLAKMPGVESSSG